MLTSNYHFTVSEVFPDGRVMVLVYVRIGNRITIIMDVYDDSALITGKRYLDLHLNNSQPIAGLTGNVASREW